MDTRIQKGDFKTASRRRVPLDNRGDIATNRFEDPTHRCH